MNRASQPKTISARKFATARFLVGLWLLLSALVFYYFAVLRIDYSETELLGLPPYPDAVEYFAQANALLNDGWPSIQIGYDKLPSRFPFGYPMLMVPWLKVLPKADALLAPFRTNQTLGLLLLLVVFGFYAYLTMPLTGGFATLLLATLPGFFTFCRSSLSDISASALIVAAFMFTYLGLDRGSRWKIYLSAVFLGLSFSIRLQSLFFAPLLIAMALFPAKEPPLRHFSHCIGIMIVFVLAAGPLLLMNTIQFHSPLRTGYDFWVFQLARSWDLPPLFSLRYVPMNATHLWNEFALRHTGYCAANIFGTGTYFVPPFVLLVGVALFFIQIDRFALCALLSSLSFLAATLGYALADTRSYLPLSILSVAVAVLPMTWSAQNLRNRKRMIAALAMFALFGAACLGYPSRSNYNKPGVNRFQAWDALQFTNAPRQSIEFVAQRCFAKLLGGQPGIVLTDIDPVYLNSLLPPGFVAAPIDGNHNYKWSLAWRYERPQALALVEHALAQSLPVYALFATRDEITTKQSRLPPIVGYEWHLLNSPCDQTTILKLTPVAADETMPPPG
jgi:hypothetical protein